MRILHLAPLWFPISTDAPGGIETFLAHLLHQLEILGCENTVLASGDSQVHGRLCPVVEDNLYDRMKNGRAAELVYYEQHQFRMALAASRDYDIIHSHLGPGAYFLSGL